MSDTIELLETIGKNASLRHATGETLGRTLVQVGASAALMAAVLLGDSSQLSSELGSKAMKVNHDVHAFAIVETELDRTNS